MTLLIVSGLVFLTGCGNSTSTHTKPTLAEAIKSSKANTLAGEEGAYIIFVQSRDGTTMVNDVEALDTLYFLSAVEPNQTHVYETDKYINVLDERVVDSPWMETAVYHPANLPDIDFDKAYSSVKAIAGDRPIANIAVFYALEPENPLIVSYTLKGDTADSCTQYQYYEDTGEVYQTGIEVKCFFNINPVPELESEGFTGSIFSEILAGLVDGAAGKIGENVMGDFLALLGWGDSGNEEEEKTLDHIDSQLNVISHELNEIEGELQTVLIDIKVSEDSIKNDVNWPRDAVTKIATATQEMQLLGEDVKPGEGNRTKIVNLANDILGAKYDIPNQVMSIYTSIEGNPTPLFSNYVDQVMLQLTYNDNENLKKAYQGFEYYTSELLNNQVKGINLVVEAYKAKDDNASAQKYLDCYRSKPENTSECNILYKEIGDMDNKNSFIYNAVSMVLRDAPLYNPFLPTSAESILKRAEFYRLLMTGTDEKEFGLRIFHISTADMEKAPDTLYVFKPGFESTCTSSSHTVKGRVYDFWEKSTVRASTDYNVVEYNCGHVPEGNYSVFVDLDKRLGDAEVNQYDINYDLNRSGTISYGFVLLTNNIANRFTESSDKWSIQKPGKDNYNSSTSGSANNWPIKAYAYNKKDGYESNAHIELDGSFTYDENAEERTMYVDYHAKFYTKADAPFSNATGGGDAYSYYYVGVWDATSGSYASNDCKNSTYYRLHASSTHKYSSHHDVSKYCSFTAKPGHEYYVYFKMIANECCNPNTVAESELDTVYRVYIMYTR